MSNINFNLSEPMDFRLLPTLELFYHKEYGYYALFVDKVSNKRIAIPLSSSSALDSLKDQYEKIVGIKPVEVNLPSNEMKQLLKLCE